MKARILISLVAGLIVSSLWLLGNTLLVARDLGCSPSEAFNLTWVLTAQAMMVFVGMITFIVCCLFPVKD